MNLLVCEDRPMEEQLRKEPKPVTIGFVAIAVIMFFAALATDVFWLARLTERPLAQKILAEPLVHDAFAVPDIVLSVLLYIGAAGLILQKKYGFIVSWVALGMWIFDALLVLRLTNFANIGFIGPSLVFAVVSIAYLWRKFPGIP
jgi:hypothetical protein